MGANNKPQKAPSKQPQETFSKGSQSPKIQSTPQKQTSFIIESKEPQQFSIPQVIKNREQVRQCINKYNDKVELEMKKKYVQDFFAMRQKLLKSMESICKADYTLSKQTKKAIPSKEFKECMQSVQTLINQEDNRMQVEFGQKLFLLADKCLIKEERAQANQKHKINPVQKCVEKLLKYRSLNMEMHILKLEMAKELL